MSWLLFVALAVAEPAWEPMVCPPPGTTFVVCEPQASPPAVSVAPSPPVTPPPAPPDTRSWLFGGVLALALARGLVVARDRIDPRGALTPWLAGARLALGIAGVIAVGVAVDAVLLAVTQPVALGLLAIATVIAGRDTVPEVLAGLVVRVEHRVRRGLRVSVGATSGVVEQLGLRAVWVREGTGALAAIPYRRVLGEGVVVDPERWPVVELEVPSGPAPADVVAAARLLPWLAPGSPVEVAPGPAGLRVRVRLLDASWTSAAGAVLRGRFAS